MKTYIGQTYLKQIKEATTRVELEHITRKAIISSDISKDEYGEIAMQVAIRKAELGL